MWTAYDSLVYSYVPGLDKLLHSVKSKIYVLRSSNIPRLSLEAFSDLS